MNTEAAQSVLIIEDDKALLRGLSDNFRSRGYVVYTADDGEKGLDEALARRPDLIILDLMLPKMNGYEICRLVREEGIDTPILMLTAKDEESDIVLGLNLGADDYVTKPFGVRELFARVQALLRRRRMDAPENFEFGPFVLQRDSRRLLRDGAEIDLTPKEFSLLAFLIERCGRALTRRQILAGVWGYQVFVTERSVDRCVTTLRQKIEVDPHRPVYLQTVREIGYRFQTET